MDWNRAIEEEAAELKSVAARLLSLAALAEKVAVLPHVVRCLVMWFLRKAERVGRHYALEQTDMAGLEQDLLPFDLKPFGNTEDDARNLAACLWASAQILEGLADYILLGRELSSRPERRRDQRLAQSGGEPRDVRFDFAFIRHGKQQPQRLAAQLNELIGGAALALQRCLGLRAALSDRANRAEAGVQQWNTSRRRWRRAQGCERIQSI